MRRCRIYPRVSLVALCGPMVKTTWVRLGEIRTAWPGTFIFRGRVLYTYYMLKIISILHLHNLWIGLVLLGLLLACVSVTLLLVLGYGWIRWRADDESAGTLNALVAASVLGLSLSGFFWISVLLAALFGYVDARYLDPVGIVQFAAFSSAGVAGLLVLRAVRRDRARGPPRGTSPR